MIELFIFFETSPNAVIGFVGTAATFYIGYLLPVLIKMKLNLKGSTIHDEDNQKLSLI